MRNLGFTLLELIVTVALVGIIAGFAIPAFRTTIQNNQLSSCSNKLVAAIQLAKSEAITSRQTLIVANDPLATYQPAFRVGSDPDGNNAVEDVDLMQSFECQATGITMTPLPNVTYVSFGPNGFRADGQGQVVFTTCNDIGSGKILTVTNGGGVSTADAPGGTC